jgi:pimeloyl-ACP methyl ester carboxylesterase
MMPEARCLWYSALPGGRMRREGDRLTRVLLFCLLLQSAFPVFSGATGELAGDMESGDMITIDTETYTFRAVERGDQADEPVILLHGFPETSHMWSSMQDLLARNGYYSLAPDQRGYSPGARPSRKSAYRIDALAGDVIALADSKGLHSFHLIGHDWGSAVAWYLAAHYPDRVRSLTAMSVPHLEAFRRAVTTDPLQYDASSYVRLFRWPLLPEIFLRSRQFRNMKSIWDQSSDEEIDHYLSVFRQRGAVTAALNWYRANYRVLAGDDTTIGPVEVPTLFVWGTGDPAILRSGAELNRNYVSGSYSEYFIDAGHWLVQESFPEVSARILEHLNAWSSGRSE